MIVYNWYAAEAMVIAIKAPSGSEPIGFGAEPCMSRLGTSRWRARLRSTSFCVKSEMRLESWRISEDMIGARRNPGSLFKYLWATKSELRRAKTNGVDAPPYARLIYLGAGRAMPDRVIIGYSAAYLRIRCVLLFRCKTSVQENSDGS